MRNPFAPQAWPQLLRIAVAASAVCCMAGEAAAQDEPVGRPPTANDALRLRVAGIEATADGVRRYLQRVLDDAEQGERRSEQLIVDLGDSQFRVRERATRELAEMAFPPLPLLEQATEDQDPERRLRARTVLALLAYRESSSLLLPVMRAVAENELEVGLPLLVRVLDRAQSPVIRDAVLAAMIATIAPSDRQVAEALLERDELELRNFGRRLLAHLRDPTAKPLLEGTFEAVELKPGNVAGGGSNLVQGWEFEPRTKLIVTSLGIYDARADGLADAHQVAIWDLNDRKSPVAESRFDEGADAELVGHFRYQAVTPVELEAGRKYAVVAHYPSPHDSSVSMSNPSGLTLKFADHLLMGGRRYTFPHEQMAFPDRSQGDLNTATFGPTFRFRANPSY